MNDMKKRIALYKLGYLIKIGNPLQWEKDGKLFSELEVIQVLRDKGIWEDDCEIHKLDLI